MLPQLIVLTLVPMSSVTATVNEVVYQGTLTNDKWYIDVDELGACVINGTKADGSGTEQTSLNINYVGQYEVMLGTLDPVLNNNSWAMIRAAADNNIGQNYWSVGDAKQIALNGKVGNLTLNNYQPWVYILGFNHNAELEGQNMIHFGFGTTTQSNGANITLIDNQYNNSGSSTAFRMNTSDTNVGGWESSYMRQTIINANASSATSGSTNSFLSILTSDLQSVLKQCTKYTDNVGGGTNNQSNVTATQDWAFLLSEFEVQGARTYANQYEQQYQKQYQYYIDGNSKIKYQYNNTGNVLTWWNRSPATPGNSVFCRVFTDGTRNVGVAFYSNGFAPAFCV